VQHYIAQSGSFISPAVTTAIHCDSEEDVMIQAKQSVKLSFTGFIFRWLDSDGDWCERYLKDSSAAWLERQST